MTSTLLSKRTKPEDLRRGLKDSLAVAVGFIPFALVLGSQAVGKGFAVFEVPILTGLNFGGGSEFAAIGLWTSPPQLALLVGVTLLVNSRHLLMGATLVPYVREIPRKTMLACLFLMCDESWAMSLADAQKREKNGEPKGLSLGYFLGLSVVLYSTWVVFTAIGAWLGSSTGDVTQYGFDMAFPAVFFVLLRGMWQQSHFAPWSVSLLVAVAVYLFVPGALYVLSGTLAGLLVALRHSKGRTVEG